MLICKFSTRSIACLQPACENISMQPNQVEICAEVELRTYADLR